MHFPCCELFTKSVLCQDDQICQGCLPLSDFLFMIESVILQLCKGRDCSVENEERYKRFSSSCSANDFCPGEKKVNPKVIANALQDILAGLVEEVKEIENLYNLSKDGFCSLVYLALLPKESTTVFGGLACPFFYQMLPLNCPSTGQARSWAKQRRSPCSCVNDTLEASPVQALT